jgi:hypothetical protein
MQGRLAAPVAEMNARSERAAMDHGRPLIWLAGVALVDVRGEFPAPFPRRDLSLVRFVSVHHDAVFYADDPLPGDDFAAEMARIAAVDRYHRGLGWPGIGYHTYGFSSGRLYLTGGFETQRANVARRNHLSIGHCVAGDFTRRVPPLGSQLGAAMAALAAYAAVGRLLAVQSHHDVAPVSDPTACPGATRDRWVPRLPQAIEAIARQRSLNATRP